MTENEFEGGDFGNVEAPQPRACSSSVPTLIVVTGTFERRALLERAIESIRKGVENALTYEIVVVDGGSTKDDTRTWLATQPDVVLLGHRGLRGAVEAYNHAFAYAVDRGAPFIAVMNDDCLIANAEPNALDTAVTALRANPALGAIAFAFDLFTHTGWGHDHVYGLPYVNYGVFRREAGMAAAKAQGDPTGRRWWNPIYHTYAADCELGVWVWKLGWKIEASLAINVTDKSARVEDVLRENNRSRDHMRRDTKLFYERWANEALVREPTALPARPAFTALAPPSVRRILITGGTGFLGRWTAGQLRKTFEAMPTVKGVVTRELRDQAADHVVLWPVGAKDADLRDATATRLLFDRVRPDLVIHVADASNLVDNMQMGMSVMAECARHPVRRLVMINAERALVDLVGVYQTSHGLEAVVVMLTDLYGEGAADGPVATMVTRFRAAKAAQGPVELADLDQACDPLHAEDAARGIVMIAQAPFARLTAAAGATPPVIDLRGDTVISMAGLADMIGNLTEFVGSVTWWNGLGTRRTRHPLDSGRAQSLGWAPSVPLETGLKRVIAWPHDR